MLHLDRRPQWEWQVQRDRLHAVCVWVQSQADTVQESLSPHPQLRAAHEHPVLHRQRPFPENSGSSTCFCFQN